MTPLEALRELQTRSLVTIEDGEPCDAELIPAMSRAEIDRFEASIGAPLPLEIRELLAYAAGVEVDCEQLAWNGQLVGQDLPDVFPRSVAVMEDGLGNSWDVDINRETGEWGAVYYLCHDPAVVVRQADSLAAFIIQFADDCCQPEREGSLYYVAEQLGHKVWDTGGASIELASLRESTDPVLKRAAACAQDGLVFDLRRARMGDGVEWGRFGPRTVIRRPGPEPVWVVERPAGVKKWWKLWG